MVITAIKGASAYEDKPNTWRPVRRKGQGPTATYVCPNGHVGLLDDHIIHSDGKVEPSVVCTGYPQGWRSATSPAEPCDFHDHLLLEGWAHDAP